MRRRWNSDTAFGVAFTTLLLLALGYWVWVCFWSPIARPR